MFQTIANRCKPDQMSYAVRKHLVEETIHIVIIVVKYFNTSCLSTLASGVKKKNQNTILFLSRLAPYQQAKHSSLLGIFS